MSHARSGKKYFHHYRESKTNVNKENEKREKKKIEVQDTLIRQLDIHIIEKAQKTEVEEEIKTVHQRRSTYFGTPITNLNLKYIIILKS